MQQAARLTFKATYRGGSQLGLPNNRTKLTKPALTAADAGFAAYPGVGRRSPGGQAMGGEHACVAILQRATPHLEYSSQ